MILLLAYLLDFITNIIPLFMPPTWLLLSFFRVHYGLPVWLLAPGGALCSTAGRCILALGSRHLGARVLPEKERKNITDLGEFIRHKKLSFVGVLFYAFGPIPSSHLFIAAGLARLNLKVVAAAFFLGRLVSYTVLVAGAGALGDQLIPCSKSSSATGSRMPLRRLRSFSSSPSSRSTGARCSVGGGIPRSVMSMRASLMRPVRRTRYAAIER
jgi:membrane protein YqaA with SNARE-associated domain